MLALCAAPRHYLLESQAHPREAPASASAVRPRAAWDICRHHRRNYSQRGSAHATVGIACSGLSDQAVACTPPLTWHMPSQRRSTALHSLARLLCAAAPRNARFMQQAN